MLQRQKRNAIFDVKVLLPIDSREVLPVRQTKRSTLFLGLGRDGVHDHRSP